jgi:hypothetical protein
MNERQPYEQLIAEKLQQLPVPDVDRSWQQMKRLLDDNHSPGGDGGRKRFRPGGGGGWWGAGIIAAVLITGIWVYMETRPSPAQQGLASANHAAQTNTGAGNKDAPANGPASAVTTFHHSSTDNNTDKTSTQPNAANSSTGTAAADKADNTAGQPAGNPTVTNSNNNGSVDGNGAAADNNNNRHNNHNSNTGSKESASTASTGSLPVTADKDRPAPDYSKSLPKKKKPSDKTASNRPGSRYRRLVPAPGKPGSNMPADNAPGSKDKTTIAKTSKTPGSTPHRNRTNNHPGNNNNNGNLAARTHRRPLHTNPSGAKDTSGAGGRNQLLTGGRTSQPATGSTASPADEQRLAKQRERREHLRELVEPIPHGEVNSSLAGGDSANPYKDTSHLLNNKTKALIAKSLQPDNNAAVAKKLRKPFRVAIKPFTLKTDADAWWAAGLSFNAPLPVAGQNRYNYNINGGHSLITDYLPSPYVEFHLNSSVYLHTEINLSMPQYVPPLHLYQKTGPAYAGTQPWMRDKSIYIQKLYYFSWPVSLHYSPVENLYLTTGLQFSSLQSGLATIDERRFNALGGTPDTMNHQVVKFKDDSIAAQLRPNEWRWQLGAEYYWKRFTVGMRYNKAFTNLVSVGPANGVPEAKIRNSSVLFFLRVNLFEGRKKDNPNNTTLRSLVRY